MQVKQMFVVGALALATGAVFAQESAGVPLSRAEVVQSVLAARAAGTLMPAGEGAGPGYPGAGDLTSTVSRAAVKAAVLEARAKGELLPPSGVMDWKGVRALAAETPPSTLARSTVREEVLAARDAGTLMPAGEVGFGGSESPAQIARHATPAHEVIASHNPK
jgi:hypothetical protein